MLNFTMEQKVKILSGVGKVQLIGELMRQEGKNKALLVCDKGTIAAGLVDKVTEVFHKENIEYVIFDEVEPDPPVSIVTKGSKICQEEDCDFVIAIGGGSSIDTGKAINILRYNEEPITRFAEMGTPMKESKGFLAIPTTAGTGSEVSDGIILTDTEKNLKFAILAPEGIPEFAIVDPTLMTTMPAGLTVSTGLDALAHVVEGYTSNLSNAYSDILCEKVIETIVEYLPIAYKDGENIEARSKMAAAATYGGWMLVNVHAHLGHAIAHAIGGKMHIPHGLAAAYVLPYAIEHVAEEIPEKIKKLIGFFGGSVDENAEAKDLGPVIRDLILDFTKKLDVQPQLPEKMDATFEEVAEEAVVEVHQNFAYKRMNKEEVVSTLEKIFN